MRNDSFSHYIAEWTPKKILDHLKLKTECKLTSPEGFQTVEYLTSAEYSHKKFKVKTEFGSNPMHLKTSVTAGLPEYGVGLDCKYDI